MPFTSFADHLFAIALKAWDKLPQLLLTFIVGYILIKIVKAVLHSLVKVSRTNMAMKGILMSLIDIGLWIFVISALLSQIGLNQIALALSSSVVVVSLAISVGSTALVQDLVAGLFLAQDRDFNPGDTVKIGEVVGWVERMDARKVRIRDEKGNLHIFPNSKFDKEDWIVLAKKEGGK